MTENRDATLEATRMLDMLERDRAARDGSSQTDA